MKSKSSHQLPQRTGVMRQAICVALPDLCRQARVSVVCVVVAFMVAAPGATRADTAQAQALLREYKCYLCHGDSEAKAGPAYVDVAAKYRGNRGAVAAIAAVVKKGSRSGGPWHMPPHPEVSDTDARIMARYILSLKR